MLVCVLDVCVSWLFASGHGDRRSVFIMRNAVMTIIITQSHCLSKQMRAVFERKVWSECLAGVSVSHARTHAFGASRLATSDLEKKTTVLQSTFVFRICKLKTCVIVSLNLLSRLPIHNTTQKLNSVFVIIILSFSISKTGCHFCYLSCTVLWSKSQ